jgi:hypothetical protein
MNHIPRCINTFDANKNFADAFLSFEDRKTLELFLEDEKTFAELEAF